MDAIIIDDGPFGQILSYHFGFNHLCKRLDNEPREIAAEVVELRAQMPSDSDRIPILINIEGHFGKTSKRQEQKGVEVLLWLRCKHKVPNPVVLYSFQPNHVLLKKKPEHLVIHSDGCSYVNLPGDFGMLSRALEGVKSWDGLKKYLRPAFSIEQFRHREANWWGVKCLWDVHRVRTGGRFKEAYPAKVEEKLNILNNVIADFCFGVGIKRLEDVLVKRRAELERRLEQLNHDLSLAEGQKSQTIENVSFWRAFIASITEKLEILKKSFSKYVSYFAQHFAEREAAEVEIRSKEAERGEAQDVLTDVQRQQREHDKLVEGIEVNIENIKGQVNNLFESIRGDFFPRELNKLDKKLLYIDDQANDGWADIFQFVLYGRNRDDRFSFLEFDSGYSEGGGIHKKIEEVFEALGAKAKEFQPEIVLLDVRLVPAYDDSVGHDVRLMSGCLLLKEIRRVWPGIPVIVISGSNKIWTYQEMIKLGADGYWIKEGLDEQRTAEESVDNYINLRDLVARATRREYKELKRISGLVEDLWRKNGDTTNFWWEVKDWNFEYVVVYERREYPLIPRTTKVNRETIKEILTDSLAMMRQYYHATVMGLGYNTFSGKSWYLPSQTILHLSNIIELVHGFAEIRGNVALFPNRNELKYRHYADKVTIEGLKNKKRVRRQDMDGGALYDVRNKAAHYSTTTTLTVEEMISFFDNVLTYLVTDPCPHPEHVCRYEKAGFVYSDAACRILADER